MRHLDEIAMYAAVRASDDVPVDAMTVAAHLGIPAKRARYLLEKWMGYRYVMLIGDSELVFFDRAPAKLLPWGEVR